MALKFFAEQKCDLVIWETGLGGRLDATNIVTPLASVITNIAFDHQQWLGDTLEKIAAEKAGIIKPGVPVMTATDEPEALAVIEKIAREKNAPLIKINSRRDGVRRPNQNQSGSPTRQPSPLKICRCRANIKKSTPRWRWRRSKFCKSKFRWRRKKSAPVWPSVNWPGRLQLVTNRASGQKILLDGAHNVAGAKALRAALKKICLRRSAQHSFSACCRTRIGGTSAKFSHRWRREFSPCRLPANARPMHSELAEACRSANPTAEVIACADPCRGVDARQIGRGRFRRRHRFALSRRRGAGTARPFTGGRGERGLNEWSATRHRLPPQISSDELNSKQPLISCSPSR